MTLLALIFLSVKGQANGQCSAYYKDQHCGAVSHVTGSMGSDTDSPSKCAMVVAQECEHKEFFTWRSTNNACHCLAQATCDSSNLRSNPGLNIYRVSGCASNDPSDSSEQCSAYYKDQHCGAVSHVTGSMGSDTDSPSKCAMVVAQECEHKEFFTWRSTNNACHCLAQATCDSSNLRSNPGLNIYRVSGCASNDPIDPSDPSDNSLAFIKNCRWESSHDQTPNSADYMGWTCADNEILTGFGLSANQHDVTKVQCCKLGGHSSVKPNTCAYVDSNHERAKCGNGNDHMVFSGAYDKRAATVDAVTEILAGKCCEVECDSAWCAGKDWGVDKDNCQVISTSNTNAQELVCPTGTLLTEVEDGFAGNAHGVQKVASVTCCALDLIAAPTMAPTTARPTSAPTQTPTTSMPTLAPTSTGDCLIGLLRDMQLTDSEYLSGIDRCLPGCRSQPYVPHRRRLLSEKNRRQ